MSEGDFRAVDPDQVERRLADHEVAWPRPRVVATTGSTNADVLALAANGAPEGTVVLADEQTSGRGRLGRSWVSAPGAGLWCSTLLRLPVEGARGLLPLLAGVVVADAVRRHGVPATLKWPNDVVVDGDAFDGSAGPRKLAGILAETDGSDGVVVGIGVNVSQRSEELPIPAATSLLLEGAVVARDDLLVDILVGLHDAAADLRETGGSRLMGEYRRLSLTLGRDVSVALPNGEVLEGRAFAIGDDGRLEIQTSEKAVFVAAGDVLHATI